MKYRIRASQIGRIMTDARKKGEILSEGAKTFLENEVHQFYYGYSAFEGNSYTKKGIAVEDLSIELYNNVFFCDYKKNTERKENDWLTGECDIFTGSKIIDIKSSWSLSTFPGIPRQGENPIYEWQLRAYMHLWDVDDAELAYCLVNTPDELIGYERDELHNIEHRIEPGLEHAHGKCRPSEQDDRLCGQCDR